MADKKISQLTALSAANLAPSTDVLAIVDTSATETKKILAQDLINGVLNVASAVGIGTASPSYKLDVNGQVIGLGTNTASSGNGGQLRFRDDTGTFRWLVGMSGAAGTSFLFYDNVASLTRLTLDSSGNLGIGTASPAQKLDVDGGMKGGVIHRKGTYSAGATTPSVSGVSYLDINNSSPTSITNFTNAVEGQMLMLVFRNANTTITRNNTYLAGSVNFTSATNATLTLIYDGTSWYEVCRSTTNG